MENYIVNELIHELSSWESSDDEATDDDRDVDQLLIWKATKQATIPRIEYYVENTVSRYTPKIFQSHFRLSRHIVYALIDRLQASGILPMQSFGRKKITAEKAFLMFVWYISNTETFRQVSDRFCVSYSSAHRSLIRVLHFVLNLRTEFIKWPSVQEYAEISREFCRKQNIPNIVGAIDGCHVAIRRPLQHSEVYINRHKYYSILIQGTVDHRKQFLDVYCGEPGSIHDARLLRKSNLYDKAQQNGNYFGQYFLLGDSAYPSLRWLVPPFKDNGALTEQQRRFNFKHSSCRIVVEHTFGLLKGRFRRLQHLDNLDIQTSVKIVMACCILHNVCQMYKDDTVIEPYDITNDVDNTPEAWADVIVSNSRREEVFRHMFHNE